MTRKSATISTRRDLFDHLEERMNRTYRQVFDSGKLEYESTYVKTFLLEFDWNPNSLDRDETTYLREALTITSQDQKKSVPPPQVKPTSEEGFYEIDWHRPKTTLRMYLDTISDPQRRFWLAYSLSDAVELDLVIDRLAAFQPSFDRAWLWPDLLKNTQKHGEFRGVGLDFDYRVFETQGSKLASTNYFKVQIWGGPDTEQILDFISSHEPFKKRTVLSKIRMKYSDSIDRDRFALEDIKYNGKFTTRGTSFSAHQSLVSDLRSFYSTKIKQVEAQHIIRRSEEGLDGGITGEPIFFNLDKAPIENLEEFCKVVFSGHLPFRLWGIPQPNSTNKEGFMVPAVDLHTGSKLFFEIYHDIVSVYLYPGACGNTIARFYTNMQHTFSRLVNAEDHNGNSIF